jgi:hypothetical protein
LVANTLISKSARENMAILLLFEQAPAAAAF